MLVQGWVSGYPEHSPTLRAYEVEGGTLEDPMLEKEMVVVGKRRSLTGMNW